jgi:hypothetical protein
MNNDEVDYRQFNLVNRPDKDDVLSAKAFAALTVAVTRGVNLSGESLSKHFKEGRDVFRKAIKELENKGFVIRTREKINDDWVSTNRVTNSGMDYISESLNISLWSRELVVQPFNQSISTEEQILIDQKNEIFKYLKEEIKKATAAS